MLGLKSCRAMQNTSLRVRQMTVEFKNHFGLRSAPPTASKLWVNLRLIARENSQCVRHVAPRTFANLLNCKLANAVGAR
jgi:hypothetical protein